MWFSRLGHSTTLQGLLALLVFVCLLLIVHFIFEARPECPNCNSGNVDGEEIDALPYLRCRGCGKEWRP